MILDKLTALSIARKGIRENNSPERIKAKLLKYSYLEHNDLKFHTNRTQLLIDKILVEAQQKENSPR